MPRTLAESESKSNNELIRQYPGMAPVSYGQQRIFFVARAKQVVLSEVRKERQDLSEPFQSIASSSKDLNAYVKTAFQAVVAEKSQTYREEADIDEDEDLYIESQAKQFDEAKEELLKLYKGKYILFEDGKVLAVGESRASIATLVYKTKGMRPLFIEKVSSEPSKRFIWTPIPLTKKKS